MAGDHDDDVARALLIFVRASAIFVGLAVIALIALFVIGRFSPGSSVANAGPYNVATRPLPSAEKPETLLPDQLGAFKRTSLRGSLSDFSVVYGRGKDQITITGSQAVSVRAAQASLSQIARSSGAANTSQLTDSDPSYYLQVRDNGGSTRYAWSHDRWFFDIQASSKAALDDFMQVFKY
jgi:hypothetical protein